MTNIIHDDLATTDERMSEYAQWCRSWGAAPETVRARCVVISAGYREWPPEPTTADLSRWLSNPRFSPWTRVTYYNHLRSWFGWLRSTGQRVDDPTDGLRPPRSPKGAPRPLSADEVSKILAASSGDLHTWLLLGLFAGLRAHEVAKFKGDDITQETIYVVGKGGLSAYIPTHPRLWQVAQDYPRAGYWFPGKGAGRHLSVQQVSTRTTALFARCGISGSFHRCRHTFGTNLLRAGANIRVVQSLMRHASLATTSAYLQVTDGERASAVHLLGA